MTFQQEEKIAGIIAGKILGTITAQEQDELNRWLALSPQNRVLFERLVSSDRRSAVNTTTIPAGQIESDLARIKQRAAVIIRGRRRSRLAWAASVAALVGVAVWLSLGGSDSISPEAPEPNRILLTVGQFDPVVIENTEDETAWKEYAASPATGETTQETTFVTVQVPRGGEYKLQLSDGSVVWLNSETKIEYPVDFGQGERRVSLSGEAFFEVAPNDKAPFTVVTENSLITVLGTSFNVSAYSTDRATTTTLLTGKVRVRSGEATAELDPGQQARVGHGSEQIVVREVNPAGFVSWTAGVFEFENMPLKEICHTLSRWYDVSFSFNDQCGAERVTGAIWKHKPLDESLEGIEMVTDISFKVKGRKVTVKLK